MGYRTDLSELFQFGIPASCESSVFHRRETYSVLVLRLPYPGYKCLFDSLCESLAGNDTGMGWLSSGYLSGGGESAGGGDVVALVVEVMPDEDRRWMVVDWERM